MTDPFVVVGGDAAGLSAASKFRRADGDRDVIVFERGSWVSYAHCGMPYYVKGAVPNLTDLLSLTPSEIEARGIDLRRGHEVIHVDTRARRVVVEHDDERREQPYGELLLATGARAVTDPVAGHDRFGVFTMHGMDSAAAMRAYLEAPDASDPASIGAEFADRELVGRYAAAEPPETAAIVGGGYVGVEMAEALAAHDLDITLYQRGPQLLAPFGSAVADRVADRLRNEGVTVILGTAVDESTPDGVRVGGDVVPADLVVLGIGVRPNTDFLTETPIDTHASGAIRTDEFGHTSVPGVYAAGDCATMHHAVTNEKVWVPLGLTANRAGRAVGQTVAGTPSRVGPVAGTAAVKAFDVEAARTGILDPERADAAGFDPYSTTITAGSRSGYYPGAADTTVTLTADSDTGRLLGGSIVGTDRAAIRIDIVATALQSGLTVAELERLDLAYAPPFSPVWDPILVAAKVLNGELPE